MTHETTALVIACVVLLIVSVLAMAGTLGAVLWFAARRIPKTDMAMVQEIVKLAMDTYQRGLHYEPPEVLVRGIIDQATNIQNVFAARAEADLAERELLRRQRQVPHPEDATDLMEGMETIGSRSMGVVGNQPVREDERGA